jgi:hypothetical protein
MDRRAFLSILAGAPVVFGLREVLAQEQDLRPEWFKQALARMKERKLHGVVIIAPADEAEQLELGRVLWDPNGRRIAADACGAKVFESPSSFASSFSPFLHGESGDRLKSRGEESGAAAPAEVRKALVDLGAEDIETRDRATDALLARAAELAPFYAWKRRTATDPEIGARLRSILERHFKAKAKERPESRLPFGTREPKFTEGCGGLMEVPLELEGKDYAVDCGMGRIDGDRVRKFLRFLTK